MSAAVFPAPLVFRDAPRRILVVITRRIGDVLLATPVLRSLKHAWPHAEIDVLVFAGTQGFLIGNPDVHRVVAVPERSTAGAQLKILWSLARRYDLALSLLPGDRPTIYAWVAGKRSVGLQVGDRKSAWKRRLLDAWVRFDGVDTHTVRMHLALLASVGVAPAARVLACWTPEDERLVDTSLEPLKNARFAVLHPYPKFRYKMWTAAGWTAVGTWLREQGWQVVFTGGPGADERAYNEMIAKRIEGALDLTGRLGLGAVALVLSRAAIYVGPDTAITHAAAALGVPTVALFGPTNPVKWGPWPSGHSLEANPWARTGSQASRHVRLVQGAGACVPCGQEGCERHIGSPSDCLTGLPAARVIDAIGELIG
jgi:heptosyltransferase-3